MHAHLLLHESEIQHLADLHVLKFQFLNEVSYDADLTGNGALWLDWRGEQGSNPLYIDRKERVSGTTVKDSLVLWISLTLYADRSKYETRALCRPL
jgi:hypothetical protein